MQKQTQKQTQKQKIRQWIMDRPFTWITDIAENTIWGFKNAHLKNFKNACSKIEKIVNEMEKEGLVRIDKNEEDGDRIWPQKDFRGFWKTTATVGTKPCKMPNK